MSYNSLATQSQDAELLRRIESCVQQEAHNNPTLSDSDYSKGIRSRVNTSSPLVWPVCLASEAEYAYAVDTGHEHPGGDESVIPDAVILSAVQTNWPPDPEPVG